MLKLDLHTHSCYSPDGWTSPEEMIRRAEKAGMDGFSITDHNEFDPERHRRLQDQTDLLLIPGEEVSTDKGHVLALFIQEPVPSHPRPENVVEEIHRQGGLAVLAHPYRHNASHLPELTTLFDAVEAFNGRSGPPWLSSSPNAQTQGLYRSRGFAVTAGSDSHLPWTLGNVYTRLDAAPNLTDVKEALRAGLATVHGTASLQSNRALTHLLYRSRYPTMEGWLRAPGKVASFLRRDCKRWAKRSDSETYVPKPGLAEHTSTS